MKWTAPVDLINWQHLVSIKPCGIPYLTLISAASSMSLTSHLDRLLLAQNDLPING